MYHGTDPACIGSIIRDGFKPKQCQHSGKAVYLTPSARYAAHPRYARLYKIQGRYYQVILQVRVLNKALKHWRDTEIQGPEHLRYSGKKIIGSGDTMCVQEKEVIDENHPNDNMEFLFCSEKSYVGPQDGLVVTGVLMRCLEEDPVGRSENSWWMHWARWISPDSPEKLLRDNYTVKQ